MCEDSSFMFFNTVLSSLTHEYHVTSSRTLTEKYSLNASSQTSSVLCLPDTVLYTLYRVTILSVPSLETRQYLIIQKTFNG